MPETPEMGVLLRRPVRALPSCGCTRQPSIICLHGLIAPHGHPSSSFPRVHPKNLLSLSPSRRIASPSVLCGFPALPRGKRLATRRLWAPGEGRSLGPRGPEPRGRSLLRHAPARPRPCDPRCTPLWPWGPLAGVRWRPDV